MFTPSDQSDLFDLMCADPAVAVSIFLPTHVRGAEVLARAPIRLKKLTIAAAEQLAAAGIRAGPTETLFQGRPLPAATLAQLEGPGALPVDLRVRGPPQ